MQTARIIWQDLIVPFLMRLHLYYSSTYPWQSVGKLVAFSDSHSVATPTPTSVSLDRYRAVIDHGM